MVDMYSFGIMIVPITQGVHTGCPDSGSCMKRLTWMVSPICCMVEEATTNRLPDRENYLEKVKTLDRLRDILKFSRQKCNDTANWTMLVDKIALGGLHSIRVF